GEQTQPLAAADRQQAVDRADADVERLVNGMALERIDGRAVEIDPVLAGERALAVQRPADTIQHPAEHVAAHGQLSAASSGHDTGTGLHALHPIDRHKVDLAAGEADHLGLYSILTLGCFVDDHAAAADLGLDRKSTRLNSSH